MTTREIREMTTGRSVVSYGEGSRLVTMEGDRVRTVTLRPGEGEGAHALFEEADGGTVRLFSGSKDEATAVLSRMHAVAMAPPSGATSNRSLWAVGACVVALTAASSFAGAWYVADRHQPRRVTAQAAAPDRIASNDPVEDSAFLAGGNDDKTGSVSPNGATGATVAPTTARPGGTSPSGKAPALPPPPAAVASATDAAGAKATPPRTAPPKTVPPKAMASEEPTAPSKAVGSDGGSVSGTATGTPDGPPGIGARASEAAARSRLAAESEGRTDGKAGPAAGKADAKQDGKKVAEEDAKAQLDGLKAALADLKDNPDRKLTPEILRNLPHDLAKQLVDAGVVETPGETAARASKDGGRKIAIVRLPPAVSDALRDEDGVPTVPEENSWAATGGNVVVPLPGGGEIRRPADLDAFHLKS